MRDALRSVGAIVFFVMAMMLGVGSAAIAVIWLGLKVLGHA